MNTSHFQPTDWNLIRTAHNAADAAAARKAFAKICEAYWKPLVIFAYSKVRDQTEAQTIVNDLFARISHEEFQTHNEAEPPEIAKEHLFPGMQGASPNAGTLLEKAESQRDICGRRLRDFFMNKLKDIIRTYDRAERSGKKLADVFCIDDTAMMEPQMQAKLRAAIASGHPDEAYIQACRKELEEKAVESLRSMYAQKGERERCEILLPLLLDRCEADGTAEDAAVKISAAEGVEISEQGVRTALNRMRAHFRGFLRDEVKKTVPDGSPAEVDAEFRDLYAPPPPDSGYHRPRDDEDGEARGSKAV